MKNMYFNNAGAGLMSYKTLNTVVEHLKLEMSVGAYKAANTKINEVNEFYSELIILVSIDWRLWRHEL